MTEGAMVTREEEGEISFLLSASLEALNSADRAKTRPPAVSIRPPGRRGMTVGEKILAHHALDGRGLVAPRDLIWIDVDWALASQVSWKTGHFRNDRLWLAGDRVGIRRDQRRWDAQSLIDACERAKQVFKMTDYQGANYTTLYTEFYHQRAQPGMIVLGSDPHTCSSGTMGYLSIGSGPADVTTNLAVTGRDTMLYIAQQLQHKPVVVDRIVEFTGPGSRSITCDERFTIHNVTAELGAITGIFVPDENTHKLIQKRSRAQHKQSSLYFRPDDDAQYVATYEIDLGHVRSFMAIHLNVYDVVTVSREVGICLNGGFIGSCATTEEDLTLAALVLARGLECGLRPIPMGRRVMAPGSLPILHRLHEYELINPYSDPGFEIGAPGCSYRAGNVHGFGL
ncbi:hypothetical protein BJY01DRAFT_244657 [Aspergillus pseudoustus]|uniref:Aconitase/3-isopropylmalate dehydratase large subunit alpha/beta/alpha domain-containing protein n=1 Tax=Aspergillus pseudoustus TaxID=1810923 RepID=A0ABR4KIE4_9EURO